MPKSVSKVNFFLHIDIIFIKWYTIYNIFFCGGNMVFSGIPFLFFFLPITLILYYIVPFCIKNYLLLAASLIFYAWGEPIYILLMILSTFISWLMGIMILKAPRHKKLFMVISVVFNLAILVFFKYAPLLLSTASDVFGLGLDALSLTIPIGISFYTFQTLSYNIDVYRGEVPAEKNFFILMTYISMFPQLIAGPIVRYETVREQMRKKTLSFDGFSQGTIIFLHGLFKKVIIANTIGELFDAVTAVSPATQSAATLWLGVFAFYLHIYFDFSGYSDMAIGMGKMLGFDFLPNFNYPLISVSVTDFWRRWHMSLGTWFRDYVYFPLGGSRCSKGLQIRNLLVVWCLTGFWHGDSWNFALWGIFFGVILILEKMVYGKFLAKMPKIVGRLYTIFLVTVGWAFFSIEDFSHMTSYIGKMFVNSNIVDSGFLYYLMPYLPIILIGIIFATPIFPKLREKVAAIKNPAAKSTLSICAIATYSALFVLSVALLVGNAYNPFLYFNF